jgi:hypothetical protein
LQVCQLARQHPKSAAQAGRSFLAAACSLLALQPPAEAPADSDIPAAAAATSEQPGAKKPGSRRTSTTGDGSNRRTSATGDSSNRRTSMSGAAAAGKGAKAVPAGSGLRRMSKADVPVAGAESAAAAQQLDERPRLALAAGLSLVVEGDLLAALRQADEAGRRQAARQQLQDQRAAQQAALEVGGRLLPAGTAWHLTTCRCAGHSTQVHVS